MNDNDSGNQGEEVGRTGFHFPDFSIKEDQKEPALQVKSQMTNDNTQKEESISGDVYTSGGVRTESYEEPQIPTIQPEVAKPLGEAPAYPNQNLTQLDKKKTEWIFRLGVGLMVASMVIAGIVYLTQ